MLLICSKVYKVRAKQLEMLKYIRICLSSYGFAAVMFSIMNFVAVL